MILFIVITNDIAYRLLFTNKNACSSSTDAG